MPHPETLLIDILKNSGVDFTASLPCEKIKTLLDMVGATFFHVPLTREEEGIGICAGAALAGKRPALFVQSSGVGNMLNALLSLTVFYELPLAVFVSRRGVYREKIAAQVPMGLRLPRILQGAGIALSEIDSEADFEKVGKKLPKLYERDRRHAFLMSPAVWEGSESGRENPGTVARNNSPIKTYPESVVTARPPSPPALTRYDVIKVIAPYLEGKAVVANLGWPSKELFAVRHQPSNFYMLGSMGMAAPIGLGIALATNKDVVVIDGDGSLLMNPGTLATAAFFAPKNLTIVAIDNGVYGSTGNQSTLTRSCVDLEAVARGFGFRNTEKASSEKEIAEIMKKPMPGLTFLHIPALPGNSDVPNIPIHHLEIKQTVEEFLRT